MTALAVGSSITVAVRDGGTVTVATNGGFGSAVVTTTEAGGSGAVSFGPGPERRVLGPFKEGASVVLTNSSSGAFDYEGAASVAPLLLAATAVAVNLTGSTSETAMATISIPAGALGLNGAVEVRTMWTFPNTANNKTLRVRLGGIGGTAYMGVVASTNVNVNQVTRIRNRGAANSQVGSPATLVGGVGSSGAANTTSAVDTSAAVDLVISGQLALGSETLTLESYEVWLMP